ncbi:MAG: alkaline phosphatase family protein [Planctomycetota bacterium]
MRRRVVVLGIDGATFDLIDPLLAEGAMPRLAAVLREGTRGTLTSTRPPVTGPAWTSLLTGRRPENHGILNFYVYEPGQYRRRLGSWRGARGPYLWERVEREGMTAGLVNIPMTWPPAPVRGFHVTGMLTPPGAAFTHPPELAQELTERFDYEVNQVVGGYHAGMDRERFLRDLERVHDKHVRAGLHLFDTRACDFFMLVLVGSDRLQHGFYHLWDRSHPAWSEEEAAKFGGSLRKHYEAVDSAIGEFHDRLGPEDVMLIVSDHGFGPTYMRLKINRWLEAKGLFAPIGSAATGGWRRYLRGVLTRMDVLDLRSKLPEGLHARLQRMGDSPDATCRIDWPRTAAYCPDPTSRGIYVNLVGRDPEGVVRPGAEYDALRARLKEDLLEVRAPGSGERLFPRVWLREEVYQGRFADRAPDVVFDVDDRYNVSTSLDDGPLIDVERGHTGDHNERGILVAVGGGVRRGAAIEGARLVDIAPTVLELLGAPVTSDLDGRSLAGQLIGTSADPASIGAAKSPDAAGCESEDLVLQDGKRLRYH